MKNITVKIGDYRRYGIGFYGFENENIMKTKEEILKEASGLKDSNPKWEGFRIQPQIRRKLK